MDEAIIHTHFQLLAVRRLRSSQSYSEPYKCSSPHRTPARLWWWGWWRVRVIWWTFHHLWGFAGHPQSRVTSWQWWEECWGRCSWTPPSLQLRPWWKIEVHQTRDGLKERQEGAHAFTLCLTILNVLQLLISDDEGCLFLVSCASPSYAKERERVWSKGSHLCVPEECNQDICSIESYCHFRIANSTSEGFSQLFQKFQPVCVLSLHHGDKSPSYHAANSNCPLRVTWLLFCNLIGHVRYSAWGCGSVTLLTRSFLSLWRRRGWHTRLAYSMIQKWSPTFHTINFNIWMRVHNLGGCPSNCSTCIREVFYKRIYLNCPFVILHFPCSQIWIIIHTCSAIDRATIDIITVLYGPTNLGIPVSSVFMLFTMNSQCSNTAGC